MIELPLCCKTLMGKRMCENFRTEEAQDGPVAALVLRVQDKLQLRSTKRSEAAHAHAQRLAARSTKPTTMATLARKVFLSKVQAAWIRHGGNPGWFKMTDDKLKLMDTCRARSSGATALPGAAMLEQVSDAAAEIEPQGNRPTNAAEAGGRVRPKHLNPVLRTFNDRLRVAKAVGTKIDEAFRAALLQQVKEEYQDPGAAARMRANYQNYLRPEHTPEDEPQDGELLESTCWGWGSTGMPIPLQVVKEHVSKHSLVSSREVWAAGSSDPFRITEGDAEAFEEREHQACHIPCGARPNNECMRTYVVQPFAGTLVRVFVSRGPNIWSGRSQALASGHVLDTLLRSGLVAGWLRDGLRAVACVQPCRTNSFQDMGGSGGSHS